MILQNEILFHREKNNIIAYVPMRGIAFSLNNSAFNFISDIKNNKFPKKLNAEQKIIISRLSDIGLLKETPNINYIPKNNEITSQHIVLLLTHNCNLRCAYCFSNGGHSKINMSFELASSAIRMMINQCLESDKKSIRISFHGGGEPTLAWEILKKSYYYAKKQCNKVGLKSSINMTSNCVFSKEKAEWISTHLNNITTSFDGPQEISMQHRPKANGMNSYKDVCRSLTIFRKNGCKITIRATISNINVSKLKELVDYFYGLGATRIQLEPLTATGRALNSKLQRPDINSYCFNFLSALNRGKELGCEVFSSYFRPERRVTTFCGADGRVLNVTPDGFLTTCHRVTSNNDSGSIDLIVGKYNSEYKKFILNHSQFEKLKTKSKKWNNECIGCLAKYHCAGGCFAQNAVENNDIFTPDTYRCQIAKRLCKEFLIESIKQHIN